MYDKNFEKVLDFVFKSEGGFSNNPNDFGGRTNYGITQNTYTNWLKKHNIAKRDVKDISKDEAKQIYYEEFWQKSGASNQKDLRDAYVLFDMSVNSGPKQAKKLFKESNENAYKFLDNRKNFYENIISQNPSQKEFRQGWLNRLKNVENNMNVLIKDNIYLPEYNSEVTPFDKNYNGTLNKIENLDENIKQSLKNKYLYNLHKNSNITGYASPIQENLYTVEAIKNMPDEEFRQNWDNIMKQMKTVGVPYEKELKQKHYTTPKNSHWVTINGNHVLIKD